MWDTENEESGNCNSQSSCSRQQACTFKGEGWVSCLQMGKQRLGEKPLCYITPLGTRQTGLWPKLGTGLAPSEFTATWGWGIRVAAQGPVLRAVQMELRWEPSSPTRPHVPVVLHRCCGSFQHNIQCLCPVSSSSGASRAFWTT